MVFELRENEQKTLLTLNSLDGKAGVKQIIKASGLAHAAVMRAALKLSKEKLVQLHKQKQTIVALNEEGETYTKKGLPERRLIRSLIKLGGKAKIDRVVGDAKLESQLVPIALGWLNRKGWAKIERKERTLKALKEPQKGEDEEILALLAEKGMIITEELSKEKREAVATLRKRKLVGTEEKTFRMLEFTAKGRNFVKKGVKIKNIAEKGKTCREY